MEEDGSGGERDVMSRTVHKNEFKKNSPVPFLATVDASYTTILPNARKIRCIRRMISRKLSRNRRDFLEERRRLALHRWHQWTLEHSQCTGFVRRSCFGGTAAA